MCKKCGRQLAAAAAVSLERTAIRGSAEHLNAPAAETMVIGNRYLGQTLGSYQLHKILGEGGMGCVYLAEHVKLGRKVALKMLHPELAGNPQVVRRFFDEARAVNTISHEHIVEITDFIENKGGDNYFIMELLRGEPLNDTLATIGALQLSRALGISVQICSALVAAHDVGIIHRDLKPENIFLTARGGQKDFVKLLDFGIAKLLEMDGDAPKLQRTAAGVIMGTPDYMSPEQASGREVHKTTDVYSFGVILYELCTGRKPFEEEDFGGYVVAHTTKTPVLPSKVGGSLQKIPRPLDELIMQCLAKKPVERPQMIAEVEKRLREIATSFALQLEQFDISKRVVPKGSKRTIMIGVGVVAAAALVAAVVLGGGDKKTVAADLPPMAEPAPKKIEPPQEPVEVKQVKLSFRSRPRGAEVFTSDSEVPLGKTPFSTTIESSEDTIDFEFRKEGYEPLIESVTVESDARIRVALSRVEKKSRRRRSSKRRRSKATKVVSAIDKKKDPTNAKVEGTQKKRKKKSKQSVRQGAVLDPFGD